MRARTTASEPSSRELMPLCGSPEWKRYPVALSVHWIAAAVPMQGCESAESHLPADQRVRGGAESWLRCVFTPEDGALFQVLELAFLHKHIDADVGDRSGFL